MIKAFKLLLLMVGLFALIITLLFGHRDIPLDELKAKYANEASSFVDINGMSVHIRDEGNKADTLPIVLIHGTGASLHTFEGWAAQLKEDHRVISMDLPGYGLTGPFVDGDYSIANYVEFIGELLSSLNINHCILGGNSLGGKIAWNFTLQNPNMVDKLILIDAAGYPTKAKSVPIAFQLAKVPILNKAFTYITPRFIVKRSVENVYADQSKVTEALVDRYFELSLREGNRRAFVDRLAAISVIKSYNRISSITHPTLILWGKEDQLIPLESAYQFQKDLVNDTLVVLENLGHVPMEEAPERSLKPVLDFLAR